MEIFRQFATTAESAKSGGLIEMLGIDWKILIFQILAFLVTVWVLGKFVYPWLLKSVDERRANIEASAKALAEAQSATADIEKRTLKILNEARIEASSIINTSKTEAEAVVATAEEKSKKRAEQIIVDAEAQIDKEIIAAKKDLYDEMLELVALAAEKVVGKTLSSSVDNTIIAESIKEVDSQVPDAQASRRKIAQYYATAIVGGADAKQLTAQLAKYLVDNGRTKELNIIIEDIEYQLSLDGVVTASVTSAHNLDDLTKKAVINLIAKQTGATDVRLEEQISSDMVGGVKVDLPGSEMDATVARRLKALKTNYKKKK